jgi:universal stress protein A
MKMQTIIFPSDFSHCGNSALALATVLARDTGAKLVIVHVEEPPLAYAGGDMYYGVAEPATDDLKRMLGEIKPTDPNVPFEHRMLMGEPAIAIVDLATEISADLIVLGTHGRTGLSRLLMGSVAESVVRQASCPVLTYKEPQKEE